MNLKSIFVKTESIFSGLGAVTASSCLNLDASETQMIKAGLAETLKMINLRISFQIDFRSRRMKELENGVFKFMIRSQE